MIFEKLTPKGSDVFQQLLPKAVQFNDWLLDVLNLDEKTQLEVILKKLKNRMKHIGT